MQRRASASKEEHLKLIEDFPIFWNAIKCNVVRIKITCEPDKVVAEATKLEQILPRYLNPFDYIRVTSPGSHGVKYDTIVRFNEVVRISASRLKINLITYKQDEGYAQIGARHLAERLITEGVVPRSLAERAKEKGYGA
jgi:hypothetical protein